MALPRIGSNVRVGDQAFEAMRAAIMSGEFSSGHRLQIRDLAADLGISVMPVREAIKRLEEMGLVESIPYRGAVVKALSPAELRSVYAVRRMLEVEAAELGAANAGDETVARMRAAYGAMQRALDDEDVAEYLDQDEVILDALYSESGNPVLLETIHSLWYRCRPFKIVGARREVGSGEVEPLLAFQRRLIEAVDARDARAAREITAESVDAATARITDALAVS